jgi:NAD(P)-dependent dehydrogenase (short-subunit alcohol dehydrogenase family)
LAGDVADFETIPGLFDRAEAALGAIDILVNNAGVYDPVRAEKMTPERWSRVIDVNLTAVFRMSQEFARRRFRDAAGGRIVNVGSIFGMVAGSMPGSAAYVAAKAGVHSLTRQLAVEWGPRGINVNALAPGFVPTELNETDFEKPEIREAVAQLSPLRRLGRPGELRAALLFLVAPSATYVNGATVLVDGGYTAW